MNKKRFIPCIYLKNQAAVKGFKDYTLVNADPVKLAFEYFENGADELIVFDLSDDDDSHEKALDSIKSICEAIAIPVIGAGNVKRMEDIKKLIYAGCAKAALNYSKSGNVEITKEVSLKFGRDKIVACTDDIKEITSNDAVIKEFVSEIILLNEHNIKEAMTLVDCSIIASLPDASLDKMMEILRNDQISALTGPAVNDNSKDYENIKDICRANGIEVSIFEPSVKWEDLKKNSEGMVPVIVQDYKTDQILMLAYMNEEAYLKTLKTMRMTYFSRSRNELWIKGETSGHYQYLKEMSADCDLDTILVKVHQIGAACHTGSYSCFFNEIMKTEYDKTNPYKVFESVMDVIKDRKIHPKEGSYTNYLFDKGIDKILKKVGEEATEIVIAAKNPNANEIKYEIADFLYHMMVLMAEKNVTWEDITEELSKR
ncbi:MAG: bifunctional phosphoribosyl-AMP cyclohydrolase/phosphoribosyl-ATP diphosphatase HisIE [Lachnospiraceae bacterium]|nr:bifunctional phosphoribosyl-AMP cyclohydrolase/phosphoribosyl-ATP diphosphatase HisIE [Lachnospiraceae bacterium]